MDTVSASTAPTQWISAQRWAVTSWGFGTTRPAAVRALTSVHAEVASGPACELAEDAPPGPACPAHPPSSNTVGSEARTGSSRVLPSPAIGSPYHPAPLGVSCRLGLCSEG